MKPHPGHHERQGYLVADAGLNTPYIARIPRGRRKMPPLAENLLEKQERTK
jgi:hypothetical protein